MSEQISVRLSDDDQRLLAAIVEAAKRSGLVWTTSDAVRVGLRRLHDALVTDGGGIQVGGRKR